MKYITTDTHPELKEGIMLEYSTHGQQHYTGSNMYHATHHQVKALLEKGYIKEVEEKEFTKSDMESVVYEAHKQYEGDYINLRSAAKTFVENWIKDKENERQA